MAYSQTKYITLASLNFLRGLGWQSFFPTPLPACNLTVFRLITVSCTKHSGLMLVHFFFLLCLCHLFISISIQVCFNWTIQLFVIMPFQRIQSRVFCGLSGCLLLLSLLVHLNMQQAIDFSTTNTPVLLPLELCWSFFSGMFFILLEWQQMLFIQSHMVQWNMKIFHWTLTQLVQVVCEPF